MLEQIGKSVGTIKNFQLQLIRVTNVTRENSHNELTGKFVKPHCIHIGAKPIIDASTKCIAMWTSFDAVINSIYFTPFIHNFLLLSILWRLNYNTFLAKSQYLEITHFFIFKFKSKFQICPRSGI